MVRIFTTDCRAAVPVLSALFAMRLLAEWPPTAGWVAIGTHSIGLYLAGGGELPRQRALAD
jgi:hypothetical protein